MAVSQAGWQLQALPYSPTTPLLRGASRARTYRVAQVSQGKLEAKYCEQRLLGKLWGAAEVTLLLPTTGARTVRHSEVPSVLISI